MPRRRKKKPVRIIHQSVGPLPLRLAARFVDQLLVFSDASQKRHGGLAAVLFADPDAVPLIATRTMAPIGSNELELEAALFGLEQARDHFPGQALTLFSDNLDTVTRLSLSRSRSLGLGLGQDPELAAMLAARDVTAMLERSTFCWVPGHASCRGNTLADQHAAAAAA
ncbi:RNase H family protein [Dechloromonas sp. A34]|uniref:RNase H family protein n=1 Tax=Dechloromonas sp. A34 TaxID=447588 RepID=UPI002248BB0D|nr:RNase H family protein [Dechloromonas sp. A34]